MKFVLGLKGSLRAIKNIVLAMASVYFAICCVQSLPVHVRDEEYRQLKDVKQIRFC